MGGSKMNFEHANRNNHLLEAEVAKLEAVAASFGVQVKGRVLTAEENHGHPIATFFKGHPFIVRVTNGEVPNKFEQAFVARLKGDMGKKGRNSYGV